ncbi:MAG: pantoate--beta-alanine ligase [Pseudomonadota bacterium]
MTSNRALTRLQSIVLSDPLIVHHRIAEIAALSQEWRAQRLRVGFVPTMGNLHDGHMDLFRTLAPHCDRIVCSIFANPLQFGEGEDFAAYPRTFEADQRRLVDIGCDALFAPTVDEMYGPLGMSHTKVSVKHLNNRYCGAYREGHFIGVATVVNKLFNIVLPHVAVFGEKDFQQLAVIRQMVRDLSMSVEILGSPTYREDSGLAYSSRNQYLTQEEKHTAAHLYAVLVAVRDALAAAPVESRQSVAARGIQAGLDVLTRHGFTPDYLEVADAQTLEPFDAQSSQVVILAAARLGRARLIDNLQLAL